MIYRMKDGQDYDDFDQQQEQLSHENIRIIQSGIESKKYL